MTVNLWKMYKKFYQRSYRDHMRGKSNPLSEEMTAIAHEIATKNLTKEEILSRARNLYELDPTDVFVKELLGAVKANNYEIDIPYEKRHKYQSDGKNLSGYIYIFTSSAKPNQSKLGATSLMDPLTRARKYTSKYGYTVNVFFSKYVTEPFELESEIQKIICSKKVSGNVLGDSIEWYNIEPNELKNIIEDKGIPMILENFYG